MVEVGNTLYVVDRGAWRDWLTRNHAVEPEIWLVFHTKASGQPSLPYNDAVEEALCFGWIDGRQVPHDAVVVRLHFAPRRPGGTWARSNKERVERLEREGRMTEAGRRVIEAARLDGSWTALEEIDAMVVPPDLAEAFAASPAGAAAFESFSPSVRRGFLWWIKSAKRPETRAQRIGDTVWLAERGIKVPGRRR
jgi:uncharacterized protein YdeI (YjbR/CyaY-like superfamily)